MDVKSKVNFINSITGGQKIPCPKCSTLNEADSKFCITCGSPIVRQETAAKEEPVSALTEAIICKACGKSNKSDSKFCVSCGKPLSQNVGISPPPMKKEEKADPTSESLPFAPLKKIAVEEPNIFAEGLPAWDVVPPQVMVRRKRR